MYIAFKWLTALALAMWLALCIIDFCVKNSKEIRKQDIRRETFSWTLKNVTAPLEEDSESFENQETKHLKRKYRQFDPAVLHYVMFFAGAIAVSVFNKKREIITYTKNTIAKIDVSAAFKTILVTLKKTVIINLLAIYKYLSYLWVILRTIIIRVKNFKRGMKNDLIQKHMRLNFILLNKLKEIAEERRKLRQLLIENKNIRTQFQLESMAKNRLIRHIEDTQKKIKENRSKYVSFQHLYLVTYQENMFLKARIRKLTMEKENAEKDLMDIINEVNQSNNNGLKSFCRRFIVRPTDNLLNSDVSAEVQKFLQKSRYDSRATTSWQIPTNTEVQAEPHSLKTGVTEILQDGDRLVPLVSCAPKLKGLPGECMWTVKDKDGIIEKLFECDYESDFDNGDTIRRIRQYSVYHDKDCLLDFSRSRTVITENVPLHTLYPTRERFLTGSEAFQKFLQNNKNFVQTSPAPALLY